MIRFKCNFCGRVLRANEGSAGHKGKCPKCCKIIVVPTVEKTQISIEKPAIINASASEVKPKEDRKDTFEDLRENPYQSLLLNKRSDSAEIHKERWGFLIPK